MALSEGDECPEFRLPDDRGQIVSFDELKGTAFVLYFYPKDDTSGCTTEAVDFSGLQGDFEALAIPVLGVSPDSVRKHAKFKEKHHLSVRLLSDEDKSLLDAFGVWVEKSMYGRRYMGVERTTALVGADGTIVRIWSKVKVPGHADEVLRAARQLTAAA